MNSQIKNNIKKISFGIVSLSFGIILGYGFVSGGEVVYAKFGRGIIDDTISLAKNIDIEKIKDSKLISNIFNNKAEVIATDENTLIETKDNTTKINIPTKEENSISIGWVGDIAPYNTVLDSSSGVLPFSFIKDFLTYPDIMVGNLEGAITEVEQSKCDNNEKNCFIFKGDIAFASILDEAGFDIMNLANNHAYDFGGEGYNDTREALQSKNILSTGKENEITIKMINNVKIAFIGLSPHYGSAEFKVENAERLVKKAKEEAEIVIVLFHGGGEGVQYMHVKMGEEIYLGENRGDVIAVAHSAIDAGASLVLGSGPHILKGMEWYKDKLIAYSLGNFLGNKNLITSGLSGVSAILYTNINKNGEIINAEIVPITLIDGRPKLDIERRSISIINMLSNDDFGQNKVVINEDGKILK